MRVFLTGGTGLVGSHLAEALVQRGDEVIALVRDSSDTTFLEGIGVRTTVGDVTDPVERLTEVMQGADAIVHSAALVYPGLPWPRVRAVNVEGTEGVFTAAFRAGIARAVHISSVAVYGGQTQALDESTPTDTPIPPTDLYARSKREAEAAATRVMAETGLPIQILRPAVIYGPRDRLFAPKLARLAQLPVIPLLGSGRTRLPVVYAGNVAAAAVSALDHTGAPVICNVGEDHPIGLRELMELFGRALGKRPIFLPTPRWLVRGGAAVAERLGVRIPGASELPPTRAVGLATSDNPYRTDRIRTALGWNPPFSHEEGVGQTVEWLGAQSG